MKTVSLNIVVPDEYAETVATLLHQSAIGKDLKCIGELLAARKIQVVPHLVGTSIDAHAWKAFRILDSMGSEVNRVLVPEGRDPLIYYAINIADVPPSKLREIGYKAEPIA
jgi:hypothetical protein